MAIVIYHNPACGTSRNTLAMIRQSGEEPEVIEYLLRRELDAAKSALKERKVIDRAKGILMKTKGLDEDAAYALLRQTAMRQSRKISEVAESLLSAMDLMNGPDGEGL